eukprot:gene13219-15530_t
MTTKNKPTVPSSQGGLNKKGAVSTGQFEQSTSPSNGIKDEFYSGSRGGAMNSPQGGNAGGKQQQQQQWGSLSLSQLSAQTANMPQYNPSQFPGGQQSTPPQQQTPQKQQQQQPQTTPNKQYTIQQQSYSLQQPSPQQQQQFMRRSTDYGLVSRPVDAASPLQNGKVSTYYGSKHGAVSSTSSSSSGNSPQKMKYSKEELLSLFNQAAKTPDSLVQHTHILSEEIQEPVNHSNFLYDPSNNLNKSRDRRAIGNTGLNPRGGGTSSVGGRRDLEGSGSTRLTRRGEDSPNAKPQQNPKWSGSGGSNSQSWRKDDDEKKVQVWFYLDPQSITQGPFPNQGMDDWHKAGYFSPTLKVKRGEDGQFIELRRLLAHFGERQPFTAASNVNDLAAELDQEDGDGTETEDEDDVDEQDVNTNFREIDEDEDDDEKILHGENFDQPPVVQHQPQQHQQKIPQQPVQQQQQQQFYQQPQYHPQQPQFHPFANGNGAMHPGMQQGFPSNNPSSNFFPEVLPIHTLLHGAAAKTQSETSGVGALNPEALEVYQKYMIYAQKQQLMEQQKVEQQLHQLVEQQGAVQMQIKNFYESADKNNIVNIPIHIQQLQQYLQYNQQQQQQLMQQYIQLKYIQPMQFQMPYSQMTLQQQQQQQLMQQQMMQQQQQQQHQQQLQQQQLQQQQHDFQHHDLPAPPSPQHVSQDDDHILVGNETVDISAQVVVEQIQPVQIASQDDEKIIVDNLPPWGKKQQQPQQETTQPKLSVQDHRIEEPIYEQQQQQQESLENVTSQFEQVVVINPWSTEAQKADKRSLVEIQQEELKEQKRRDRELEEQKAKEDKVAAANVLKWAQTNSTPSWGQNLEMTKPSLKDIQEEQKKKEREESLIQVEQMDNKKKPLSFTEVMKEQARENLKTKQEMQTVQQQQQQQQQTMRPQINPLSPWGVPDETKKSAPVNFSSVIQQQEKSSSGQPKPAPLQIRTTPVSSSTTTSSGSYSSDDSFWDTKPSSSRNGDYPILNILPTKQPVITVKSNPILSIKKNPSTATAQQSQPKPDFIKWCHQQLKPLTSMDVATLTELLCSLKTESEIREYAKECLGYTSEVTNFINDYLLARSDEPGLTFESSSPYITVPIKGKGQQKSPNPTTAAAKSKKRK